MIYQYIDYVYFDNCYKIIHKRSKTEIGYIKFFNRRKTWIFYPKKTWPFDNCFTTDCLNEIVDLMKSKKND